ncbi:MAG: DUF4097 domain-containing protein [Ignavibacteriae bacterium]|nr:DUF4097 domain-containing protein [Ignavibacteriota bacterium]
MKQKMILISALFLAMNILIIGQTSKPLVKSFSTNDVSELQVSVDPGNISLDTWNKNEVKIEVVSKNKYKIENLISEKRKRTIVFEIEFSDDWKNNVTLKVTAPSKFNFNLKSTGGNIDIKENISGELTAKTEGGNVRFNDVLGEVNVKTLGGNISGENVEGNVQLSTNGGNISLENVKSGKTEIETLGGNISVGSVSSDLIAKTSGGHISIDDVGGNAKVVTYGGHISLEKVNSSAVLETYGGHLSLKGASGEVVAKTNGGHISLENITGNITASTKGGHIFAELSPSTNAKSIMETLGGNIKLYVPKSAKTSINVFVENDNIEDDDVDLEKIVESDFPSSTFDVNKDDGEINAKYILNGGGSEISLKCTAGKVEIRNWER